MSDLIDPLSLPELDGGPAAWWGSVSDSLVLGMVRQNRLDDHLATLGAPGRWRCDPLKGELELRGKVFRAEMIGSWGDGSWLWSWANPFLNLPDVRTTQTREARDAASVIEIPVLACPHVFAEDVDPHLYGLVLAGNGYVEAYYVCDFPGSRSVYGLIDELPATGPKIRELDRACTAALATGHLRDAAKALAHAAFVLDVGCETTDHGIMLHDAGDTLVATLDRRGHLVEIVTNVTI